MSYVLRTDVRRAQQQLLADASCNESAGARVLFCLALPIFRVHLMKALKFLPGNQQYLRVVK